jgi:14-3-3 protein epsilon
LWLRACNEHGGSQLVSKSEAEIMVGAVEVQRRAGQIFGEEFHGLAEAAAAVSAVDKEAARSMDQLRQLANKAKHGKRRGGTKHQHDEGIQHQEFAGSHDELVYRAKLAEQAERDDDMAAHMASVCKSGNELSIVERDMLHVAYKNAVGSRREAWHIITSEELKEKSEGHDEHVAWAREYRTKVEGEVQMICNTALGIVDQCLIPKSTGESKAFYLMMKADYYRYIAEFTTGEAKAKAASRAENAYVVAAAAAAAEDVAVTHPIRLTLALNHSILLHEMQSKPEEAYKVASTAFEDANAEWDGGRYVGCKDSTVIMQLLGDNLTSWGRLALGKVESHVEQKSKKGRFF